MDILIMMKQQILKKIILKVSYILREEAKALRNKSKILREEANTIRNNSKVLREEINDIIKEPHAIKNNNTIHTQKLLNYRKIIYYQLKILRCHLKNLYVIEFYIQNLERSYLVNFDDLRVIINNEIT